MLKSKYTVKPSSIWETKVYLGADFGKVLYGYGSYAYTMISDSYVKELINNAKNRLKEYCLEYNKRLSDVNYLLKNP